jgi:hypothetical protein
MCQIGEIKHTVTYNYVVFHAESDRATKANAHLAHLQAPTHWLMLQLVKEPNFCRRTDIMIKVNMFVKNLFKQI